LARGLCLTEDRLLKLSGLVDVEEVARTECKDHALVVFLKLVVDLGRNQGCEFSLGK